MNYNKHEYCKRLKYFSYKLVKDESFLIEEIKEFILGLNTNQDIIYQKESEWKMSILDEMVGMHENSVTNLFEQFKTIENQYNEHEINIFYISVLRGLQIYP